MIVHIASVKIPECKENISPSTFYGQLPNYNSHVFSLIYPVDDFSLKEVRTWGQCKFSFYCSCVWCESRKSGGKGSSRFPCVNPMVETSSHRVTFRNPSNIVDCFRRKAPPQTSNRIPNRDPTRRDVNLGYGWTASAWNS